MKALRMHKIAALRLTRDTEDVTESICWALVRVMNKRPELELAVIELKQYIRAQLGESSFLEGWLEKHHNIDAWSNQEMKRKTRIAWINWMIGCLENTK